MSEPRYLVELARTEADVRAAQRLRWQVFAQEMGARLSSPTSGLDIDRFDAHCDHLLARLRATGEVVGTYRLLGWEAARRVGGYYLEQEFESGRLRESGERLLELGRCCVHADHRRGAVVALLWSGLADYLATRPHDHLIGCASIALDDPAYDAAAIWQSLRASHLGPPAWRTTPRRPLPLPEPAPAPASMRPPAVPPLLRAYLRAGALVCGEPALDPEFRTADLPMWLAMAKLNPTHARHFLQA
jgi:putative hemolysin